MYVFPVAAQRRRTQVHIDQVQPHPH
jgi:hypothetical protein